jgi:ATP-binding cassette subfamily B protein
VTGVIDALHAQIAEKRVDLYTVVAQSDLLVWGDPAVLQQVIADLCRYEIARAAPGDRVELRSERKPNHVWLSVLGASGAPAELSQEEARRIEDILAEAGGSFTISPVGNHLSYVAELPLSPFVVEGPPLPDEHARLLAGERSLAGLRIMAIDDQEQARDALEALLQAAGAQVQLAASASEAYELLTASPCARWPDALLVDIMLGEENGYELLGRVRRLEEERRVSPDQRIPAIALTGYVQTGDRVRARTAEFQLHLTKPVAAEALIDAIRQVAPTAKVRAVKS